MKGNGYTIEKKLLKINLMEVNLSFISIVDSLSALTSDPDFSTVRRIPIKRKKV